VQTKWLDFKGTESLSEVLRALEPESSSAQLPPLTWEHGEGLKFPS